MKKVMSYTFGALMAGAGVLAFSHFTSTVQAARRLAQPVMVCGSEPRLNSSDETCFSTCGGEIPWPFQVSNQVVELADSEHYVLMGQVAIVGDEPRFLVDLNDHPWLATARRRQDPSYPLVGSSQYWKAYDGRRIQIRAVAHWIMGDDAQIIVTLKSLSDPAVVSARPVNR